MNYFEASLQSLYSLRELSFHVSPGLVTQLNPHGDDEWVRIGDGDRGDLLDLPGHGGYGVGGNLPGERVVDLENDLRLRNLLINVHPSSVDNICNSGLWNPCEGFGEEAIQVFKVVATIPEAILNIAMRSELLLGAFVPALDPGVGSEPRVDKLLCFMSGGAEVLGESGSLS